MKNQTQILLLPKPLDWQKGLKPDDVANGVADIIELPKPLDWQKGLKHTAP